MMSRLTRLFEQKKEGLLSIFFTAGYPKLSDTLLVAEALQAAGVDLIEIGIPFSDPLADGPVIQESNKVALANGMTVSLLLQQVRTLRQSVHIPILLMGYLNPVLQYGMDRFLREAAEAGVDGLIFPDLPLAEYEAKYEPTFRAYQLSHVFLIAPTTSPARVAEIERLSTSFIYAVSASSTTGSQSAFSAAQLAYFQALKDHHFRLPVMIGFGISNEQTFQTVCQYGSGGIIGSAFIRHLGKSNNLHEAIAGFISDFKR
jgi:tryptophan synthase alpha chain